MSNGNYITIGLEFLVNKIQQQQQCLAAATSDSANSSDEASVSEVAIFTFMSQDTSSATADNILSTYTGNNSTCTSLDDLHAYPLLKNIFLN